MKQFKSVASKWEYDCGLQELDCHCLTTTTNVLLLPTDLSSVRDSGSAQY